MSFDRAQFAATLHRLRKDAGLTQGQLGAMLGITAVAISQFERGTSMPAAGTFAGLAESFGVSVGVLVGDRLALAEYAITQVRTEVRALGYDLALIPRETP